MKLFLTSLFITALGSFAASAQTETYAEKLGFPKGKKVVIFHVDDAGMSYESNVGTINAIDKGIANSTSVMMPCGWVPQFFDYLKKHPNTDSGVHLTLTSEWDNYRWTPLVGCKNAPGLCDEQGAFWHSVAQVVQHASRLKWKLKSGRNWLDTGRLEYNQPIWTRTWERFLSLSLS